MIKLLLVYGKNQNVININHQLRYGNLFNNFMRAERFGSSKPADPKAELERLLDTIKETIGRRQNRMLELQSEIDDLEKENEKLEVQRI